jgi:hypothetical protein
MTTVDLLVSLSLDRFRRTFEAGDRQRLVRPSVVPKGKFVASAERRLAGWAMDGGRGGV